LSSDRALATLNDIKASFHTSVEGFGEQQGNLTLADLIKNGLPDINGASGEINVKSSTPIDLAATAALVGVKGVGGTATLGVNGKFTASEFTGTITAAMGEFFAAQNAPEKTKPIDINLTATISAGMNGAKGHVAFVAPQAGTMSVAFDYKHPREGWNIQPGPLIAALLEGRAIELPEFQIEPTVDLNVARLAGAIPNLLNVRSDATIEEFSVQISNAVLRGGKLPRISGLINIRKARATVGGEVVNWKPTKAELAIATGSDGLLTIDKMDINVGQGLVRIIATGTTRDMTLEAHARLAELKQQLGKVFKLENMLLTGNVNIAGRIQRQTLAPVDVEKETSTQIKVDLTASAESVAYRPDLKSLGNALAVDTQAKWKSDIVRTGDSIAANGRLDLTKLLLKIAGKNIRQDAATIDHDVTFDRKRSDLTMRTLKVNSEHLTFDVQGTALGLVGKTPKLDASGTYTAEMDNLAHIVKQFRPDLAPGVAALKEMMGTFKFAGSAEKFTGSLQVGGHVGKLAATMAYTAPKTQQAIDLPKLLDALWTGNPLSLPDIKLQTDGRIKLPIIFQAASTFLNRPDLKITDGILDVTGVRFTGGSQPSASGDIRITRLAGARAGEPFQFDSLGATLSAGTDAGGRIAIADVKIDLGHAGSVTIKNLPTKTTVQAMLKLKPLGRQLAQVMDLKGIELGGDLQTNIQAIRTKPGDTRADIEAFVKTDKARFAPAAPGRIEPITLTGTANWTGVVDYKEQVITANGTGQLRDILLAIGKNKQIRENLVTLAHNVTVDMNKHNARLTKANFVSQPVTLNLTGTVDQFDKLPIISLSGRYAVAWTQVAPIVKQFVPDTPESLSHLGKTSGDFQLADSAGRVKGQFSLDGNIGKLKGQFDTVKPTEPIDAIVDRAMTAIVNNKSLSLPKLSAEIHGHIMVPPTLAASGLLANLPKDLKLTDGRLDVRSFSIRGGTKPKLKADIIATGVAGIRAGKPVKLDDITILATAGGDDTGRLHIAQADFTTVFGKAKASGSIGDFIVKADADLPKLQRQLAQFINMPDYLAGTIDLVATVKKTGKSYEKLAVGFNASAKDFQLVNASPSGLKIKPASLKPRSFTIASNGRVDLKTETIRIAKLTAKFKPELLTVNIAGTVSKQKAHWMLDLAGDYVGQWKQINALVEELSPGATKTIALTGRTSGDFVARGLSSNPTVTPTYRGMAGNTVLAWDKGMVIGLPIGAGKLAPKLADGQIVLPLTEFVTSGGTARIAATIDMRGKEPVLRLPTSLRAMKDVQLTQKFSKEVLSRINPIFAGLGFVKGKASLRMTGVEVPLGESLNTGGRGTGRMDLTEMQVRPSGLLSALLKMQGVPPEVDYAVVVSGLDFRIRKGGLEYDNFTMAFPKGLVIGFSGRVGFDDTVTMNAWTPVSDQLLQRLGVRGPTADYARVLKGTRLAIPISGNRKSPRLDMTRVNIKPLIKQAVDRLLRNSIQDLLRGGLKPKFKFP
jgi:hypothetical protein